MGYNIAIDGPAGAGKSTIAKLVAMNKGFIYVDTGAMYRALAVYFLSKDIKPEDTARIIEALPEANVTIQYVDGIQQVLLNGENVTPKLRTEEVSNMASISSVIPEVREKLFDLQQSLARDNDVVMDGRDIGTHILPNADLKIYMTASVETRAKRRHHEMIEKGVKSDLKVIMSEIEERDHRDMTREVAPLMQATDAVYLDTSKMTIPEVVGHISSLIRK